MIEFKGVLGEVLFSGEFGSLKEAVEAAVLQKVDLTYAQLESADLKGANLQGADLPYANLKGANLQGANLQDADLRWATFEGANLEGVDLKGSNLHFANLSLADLRSANLEGVNVRWVNWRDAHLEGANFEGALITYYEDEGIMKMKFVGNSPILMLESIGSRSDRLYGYRTPGGIFVETGCFLDHIDNFVEEVKKTHAGNEYEKQYLEAVELIKSKLA